MALTTECPHCGTRFRVASDQLKLRGGIVRCGACQEIFDGSATLVDPDKPAAKAAAAAPAAASETPASTASLVDTAPAPAPAAADDALPFTIVEPDDAGETDTASAPAASEQPDFDDQPVYTLDFDHTFDPLGILPKVASAGGDAAPRGEADTEAETEADTEAETVADTEAEAEAPVDDTMLRAPAATEPDPVPGAAPGTEPAEPDAAPAMEPVAAADGEVDALSLLQPWSRPSQSPDEAAAKAPQPALTDELPMPALAELPPAPREQAPAVDALAVETLPPARAGQVAPPVHASVAPDGVGRYEPVFGLPVDEELVAAPLPDHEPEPAARRASSLRHGADAAPLLTRESAASTHPAAAPVMPPGVRTPAAKRADKAAARRSKLIPTKIEPQPKLRAAEIDEPEFVKRSRHQEQLGRTRKIAMLAGSVVLLLVLIAQGALTFRSALAARFPATKPVLESSCAVFGCRVELPAQVDKLAIETGELTTLGSGAYSFTTELRNEAGTAQAWPSLELTLLDTNGKPLVRRVFAPADYLTPETVLANGMAQRAVQPILLHFRVDDLKPSGYHIAVFYP